MIRTMGRHSWWILGAGGSRPRLVCPFMVVTGAQDFLWWVRQDRRWAVSVAARKPGILYSSTVHIFPNPR